MASVNSGIGTEETRYRDFQEKGEEGQGMEWGGGGEREESEGKGRKGRVSRAE